ncbi:MAG: hypothetical protein KBD63_02750 [Bacteriovoracaceae bacterium]|nr:hypothetical protein [Bacteriovoracaceae bacterium]
MRYLSIDIEATGLDETDLIIEFAALPFDSQTREVETNLSFHHYIKCPSFEDLKPKLNPWVIEHNEKLIRQASMQGLPLLDFKQAFQTYLESDPLKNFFKGKKIILFGKSLNAIDLPFLSRDLSWDFMRKYFSHKVLDLSAVNYALIDYKKIPPHVDSGSELMKYFAMGEVAHTALEDAKNTITLYFKLLDH